MAGYNGLPLHIGSLTAVWCSDA